MQIAFRKIAGQLRRASSGKLFWDSLREVKYGFKERYLSGSACMEEP